VNSDGGTWHAESQPVYGLNVHINAIRCISCHQMDAFLETKSLVMLTVRFEQFQCGCLS